MKRRQRERLIDLGLFLLPLVLGTAFAYLLLRCATSAPSFDAALPTLPDVSFPFGPPDDADLDTGPHVPHYPPIPDACGYWNCPDVGAEP